MTIPTLKEIVKNFIFPCANLRLTKSQLITYHLLITANPLSDSKAAMAIFKMMRRLDILSGDVNVFLPGFSANEKISGDSQEEAARTIENIKLNNSKVHADYHGKDPVFHTYLENEGDVYFNDADFSNFMLDLGDKSSAFDYLGRTELVVMPSSKGKILYDRLVSYNVEALCELGGTKLEEFLIGVFKLIQKDKDCHTLALIDKISNRYQELFNKQLELNTSSVISRLDQEILKFMKWKDTDTTVFISYSSKDELQAYELKALLENEGVKVWMAPDGIPSGFDYAQVIPAAIRITSRFIVLLSNHSANSEWVRREIGKAISNKTRMDGLLLDGFSKDDINKYDHLSFMFENVQLRFRLEDLFEDKQLLHSFLNQNNI